MTVALVTTFTIMSASVGVAGMQHFALLYANGAVSMASPDKRLADVELPIIVVYLITKDMSSNSTSRCA